MVRGTAKSEKETEMWIIWTIVIGFVAGVVAKFLTPGDKHEPQGFILTTILGDRRSFRHDLPWSGSRLVSRRPEYRVYWRDPRRSLNPLGVGLHRIQASNALSGLMA